MDCRLHRSYIHPIADLGRSQLGAREEGVLEDVASRCPFSEVADLGEAVGWEANALTDGVGCTACRSYRRIDALAAREALLPLAVPDQDRIGETDGRCARELGPLRRRYVNCTRPYWTAIHQTYRRW